MLGTLLRIGTGMQNTVKKFRPPEPHISVAQSVNLEIPWTKFCLITRARLNTSFSGRKALHWLGKRIKRNVEGENEGKKRSHNYTEFRLWNFKIYRKDTWVMTGICKKASASSA